MIPNHEAEQSKLRFKSVNAILKRLSKEIMSLKVYANKLNLEIDKKVNLESEITDSELTKNHILTGIVSTNGIDITGVNTLFTKELTSGFKLNISNESKTIATIVDNTHATVESPGFSSFSNQLATITRPVTKEELVGSFSFGNLSTPFNGSINKGSSLKHYGNMVDIADVVNVGFVLKSTNAALQRAAQAIQRDGDTVGDDTSDQLNYLFQNTNWIFNDSSILKYRGQYSEPDDVATKQVIDSLKEYLDAFKTDSFYASWLQSNQNEMKAVTTNSINYYTQLGLTPSEQTDSFNDYFSITTNGLLCKKACVILVCANAKKDPASANHNSDAIGTGLILYFVKNNTILSSLSTNVDVLNTGSGYESALGGSFIINCAANDIIKVGAVSKNRTSTLYMTTSIAKMR